MDVALVTQHVVNTCQEDEGNAALATEGTPNRWKQDEALQLLR